MSHNSLCPAVTLLSAYPPLLLSFLLSLLLLLLLLQLLLRFLFSSLLLLPPLSSLFFLSIPASPVYTADIWLLPRCLPSRIAATQTRPSLFPARCLDRLFFSRIHARVTRFYTRRIRYSITFNLCKYPSVHTCFQGVNLQASTVSETVMLEVEQEDVSKTLFRN